MKQRRLRLAARSLLRRPSGLLAVLGTAALLLLVVFGPLVWGREAGVVDTLNAYAPPSASHWFGTDQLGRDVLARALAAGRLTLSLAVAAAAIGAVIGAPFGVLAVLAGARGRAVGLRLIDTLLAFPPILVALLVATVMGPSARAATLAIGLALAPGFARVASTLTASVIERDYIVAAQLVGVSKPRLMLRYIGINIADALIIQGAVAVGAALIGVSSLSFLGIGVQPPAFDWGRMLTEGLSNVYTAPAGAIAPALSIALAGLVFGFAGDLVASSFNPRAWTASGASTAGRGSAVTHVVAPVAEGATCGTTRGDDPPLLDVRNLHVRIPTADGVVVPIRGVTFSIAEAEVVGLVGESGSGKSLTALSVAQLVGPSAQVEADTLCLRGQELLRLPEGRRQRLLAEQLAMIFQDPMSSLNPAMRIGAQLTEGARHHRGIGRRAALEQAAARLSDVQIPAPAVRLRQHPYQLSGGMQQRAVIAMALMTGPSLVIADEPTTALDVTVQAQILDLLRRVNTEAGAALLLITHDMGVIAEVCSRVLVMYAGRIVEDGDIDTILNAPAHPYTRALVSAVPDLQTDRTEPLATIGGQPPGPADVIDGCAFVDRCPLAVERCTVETPQLAPLSPQHTVACWVAQDAIRDTASAEGARR